MLLSLKVGGEENQDLLLFTIGYFEFPKKGGGCFSTKTTLCSIRNFALGPFMTFNISILVHRIFLRYFSKELQLKFVKIIDLHHSCVLFSRCVPHLVCSFRSSSTSGCGLIDYKKTWPKQILPLTCCQNSVDSHLQKFAINRRSIENECALIKMRAGLFN